jgi:hypothetical protein
VVGEAQAQRLRSRFLEEVADVAAYARGAAHASTIGRQLGLSTGQVTDLLLTLHAAGLIEVDWLTRIISLTPLGQLQAQHG